ADLSGGVRLAGDADQRTGRARGNSSGSRVSGERSFVGSEEIPSAADLMLVQRERPFSFAPRLERGRVVGLAGHRRCAGSDAVRVVVALFVVVHRLPYFSRIP